MILYNKNDKFLKTIISQIEKLPILKSIKNGKKLFVYGVADSREVAVVLPKLFPNQRLILKYINNVGISTRTGCYWSMAETYNNCVLGLGLSLRKQHADLAKKAIILTYLSLNGKINYPELDRPSISRKSGSPKYGAPSLSQEDDDSTQVAIEIKKTM